MDLQSRIEACSSGRSFSLRADELGVRSIQTTIRGLCADGILKIEDAELSTDDDGTVSVAGQGALFGQISVDLRARFFVDGELTVMVLAASNFPTVWTLSSSFPAMKGSYLDGFGLRHPVITIDSRGQEADYDPEQPPSWRLARDFQTDFGLEPADQAVYDTVLRGLSFAAEVDLGPLNTMAWLLQGERAKVEGPMELVAGAPRMWCRSETLGDARLGELGFPACVELVSVLSPKLKSQSKSKSKSLEVQARAFVRVSATATYGEGEDAFELPIGARLESPKHEQITFDVGTSDLSALAFDGLARALDAGGVLDEMEGVFPALDDVVLERVGLTINMRTRGLLAVELRVGLDARMEVMADRLAFEDFRLSFVITSPGTRMSRVSAWAECAAECFGARFRGRLNLPSLDFGIYLDEGEEIDLGAIVEALVPELRGPDLEIERLDVLGCVTPARFAIFAVLAGDWSIPIGVSSLTLEQLWLRLEVSTTATPSAQLGGVIDIGGVELAADWRIPGSLMLEARVPELSLLATTETLLGKQTLKSLPFPTAMLDASLEDVVVTADLERRSFSLGATAPGLGRPELFVEKPEGAGWGMGLGLTLDSSFKLSSIDDSLALLDGLSIANAYILLSSFSPRALGMPGQPAGSGTVQRGVNFYLPVALSASGALAPLAKVIGDDGASLMLRGALTSEGCALEATMAGFEVAKGVSFESAGFRLGFEKDGDVAMAVFGRVAVELRDKLLFDARMTVEATGMMLAATMTGTWTKAFGIEGFTLADVALSVGVSVSGLPSVGLAGAAKMGGFEGSFAVLINSIDPAESVLSLRFNELTLGTFLKAAIAPAARKKLPKQLISLFDSGFRDVDIYICPESTYIGSLYYQQGFRFKAKIEIMGWNAQIDASADWSKGIKLEGSAEPLRLARIGKSKVYVLEITAADSAKLFADLERKSKGSPNAFALPATQAKTSAKKGAKQAKKVAKQAAKQAEPNATAQAKAQVPRVALGGLILEGRKKTAARVERGDFELAAGSALTAELWVKIKAPGKGERGVAALLLHLGSSPKAGRMVLRLTAAGKLLWIVGKGKGERIEAPFGKRYDRWIHLAVTCGGKAREALGLWIDGERVATATPAGAFAPTLKGLALGGNKANYRVQVAQLRVWSKLRTEVDLRLDRYKRLDADEPGVIAAYSLDAGEGFRLSRAKPAPTREAPPGDPAYALLLTGIDARGKAARAPKTKGLALNGELTIEAWIKPEGRGKAAAIVSKDPAGDFSFEIDAAGTLCFAQGGGPSKLAKPSKRPPSPAQLAKLAQQARAAGPELVSAGPAGRVTPGQWQHVAVSRKGKTLTFFLDGRAVGKAKLRGAAVATGQGVGVGARPRNAAGFRGAIAEVRIWERARSPEDIRGHARRELTGGEAGLLAYWPADEGAGARVQDFGAGGRDLVWKPATWEGAALYAPGVDRRAEARSAVVEQRAKDGEPVPVTRSAALGGPQIRASLSLYETPSFMLSARVALLGFFEEQVLIEAGKSGMKFALSRKTGAVSSQLACTVDDKGFKAKGSIKLAIKLNLKLDIPGTKTSLGRIKLDTSLGGSVDLLITARVFKLTLTGTFKWEGTTLKFPKLIISTPLPDMKSLTSHALQAIEDGAEQIFGDVLGGLDDVAEAVEKGWLAVESGADDFAKGIAKAYGAGPKEVEKLMKSAGFAPKDIEKAFNGLGKEFEKFGKNIGKEAEKFGKTIGGLFS
ncbi:hypothetical protein G6O69_15125 [Pseudenhygromyxa sp. WMMC2535]|uniref:LamG domain-containing protein n=1 Tax=Pseudenhygromyxa sp. WMMC2535 TaxID=2712867 RepID=UPI001557C16D|nr:LamG-like jellyroll fold domain-containing protein [Pseudenhygromyxa sp. WMMC2535]NVB39173.1 hypothetical protein [Pseudenhygromyxa sp. WMMC2535]